MTELTLIEKLGFDPTDKVVIFHIDDIGFSHSSNVASFKCLDFGIASCGSVIVNSPWFLEAASFCKKNPNYDVGVHLTLTCEYELYRWRALSSVDPETGLLDSESSLWRTTEEAAEKVKPKAAEKEMRAQIEMAFKHGVDVTHIDSHMGTVMHPKFLMIYLKLAREYKVAPFLPRVSKEELIAAGLGDMAEVYEKLSSQLEKSGVPILDYMIIDTLSEEPDKIDYYCRRIKEIKPGITHFLFHSAKMSPELNAITHDSKARNQDYEAFTSPKLKECVEKNDLTIIGYRNIRDLVREEK